MHALAVANCRMHDRIEKENVGQLGLDGGFAEVRYIWKSKRRRPSIVGKQSEQYSRDCSI